jgi:hypothetical protein
MLPNFPFRALFASPFILTGMVSGGAYYAARLVAEQSQSPHQVGVAAATVAVTMAGTAFGLKTYDLLRELVLARASPEPDPEIAPVTTYSNDIRSAPFHIAYKGSGKFVNFEHATDEQLVNLALWVAAGDSRLTINLWTTDQEHRKPRWVRDDFPEFLAELEGQGLASSDGHNRYHLTREGKAFLREVARISGQPLPHLPSAYTKNRAAAHARTCAQ